MELLRTLSVWLTDAQCPHYFINNCNLIDRSFGVETVAGQLNSIRVAWLSTWLVNNYIRKCSGSVSSLFSDVSTKTKLQIAVSAVVDWRLNTALKDTWHVLQIAEGIVIAWVMHCSLTTRSCNLWKTELTKTNTHLPVYFSAVALLLLHVARKISKIGFTDELTNVIATISGEHITTRRHPSQCSSELSLNKATKLMKVVANSSLNTMQLIQIELSKEYLLRALRCKDYDSDSIYCLANIYLAVLYYTTGQYQTAIDHCSLVTRSQDHSQCSCLLYTSPSPRDS